MNRRRPPRDYRAMRKAVIPALLILPLAWPAAAAEPSFACTGDLTPTETAICKDDALAALDRALAAAFKSKLDAIAARNGSCGR